MNHQQQRQSLETSSGYHDDIEDEEDVNYDIELIESNHLHPDSNSHYVDYNDNRATRRIITNSTIWKSMFLIIVILAICYNKYNVKTVIANNQQQQQQQNNNDRKSYCYDSDDSKKSIKQFVDKPSLCSCVDPEVPAARGMQAWESHHNTMVQDVVYHQRKQQLNEEVIDFILLGDSITERWNGTTNMGQVQFPEYRSVFNKYFNKYDNANASLFGLALGLSGDVCVELSWHLENGILSSSITPKVFVVLIGTNDIGRMNCSKQTVLNGIKNVIRIIHTSRPETPIIVHALLPRSDNYERVYTPGWTYDRIIWINNELETFCDLKTNNMWCYYLNVNHIFLSESSIIKKELMDDALHPTPKGCDIWGPILVDEIKKRIKE